MYYVGFRHTNKCKKVKYRSKTSNPPYADTRLIYVTFSVPNQLSRAVVYKLISITTAERTVVNQKLRWVIRL